MFDRWRDTSYIVCHRCHQPIKGADKHWCNACKAYLVRNGIGFVDGRHHLDYLDDVKQLKRENRYNEVEPLLQHLIAAVEREAADKSFEDWVGGGYVEDLAIVYRKQHRYANEIELLEWFKAQPGRRGDFSARLAKARQLFAKQHPEHPAD